MKARITFIFLSLFLLYGTVMAAVTTEELAARAKKGQEIFDASIIERDKKVAQIMGDPSMSPQGKQLAVKNIQKEFLKESREIHLKYREPFIQRVIAETNKTLPDGKKIKASLGSGIYLRDKDTDKIIRDQKGRKILNPKHRGMQGDMDLAGNPLAVKRLEGTFDKYKKIYLPRTDTTDTGTKKAMTSNIMDGPGYRDFGDVEVTINITGRTDSPGNSAHQTGVRMDAFSKETYVSASMRPNQAGRSLVETNDHFKKAAKGFVTPPAKLLGSGGEKTLQGMSKGTLKSIESGAVSDAQLSGILNKSGYQGDARTFKLQIERLKRGHIYQGVGLNANNIEAFQKSCRNTTEEALNNARQQFEKQKVNVQTRIEQYDAKIKSGELSGDQLERYKKVTQKLKNELVDSKVKIEETGLANKVKLEGGSYDDFLQKDELTRVTPVSPMPKVSRIEAVKNGLKPGLLDIAGYGATAYNVYDNITKMKKGEISQNDAVIGITKEVVDTGFGMVTDVWTAAAVGAIGTGAVGTAATIGAPMVIVAGAGYAVSTAVEEGLRTFEALKVEEIAEKIAKSKKEEVINYFQLQTDELLKAGEASGDWRYFAKADDIADSLEKMYRVTGDNDFKKNFDAIYGRITQKKEELEAKYNCSIYALKVKMEEQKKTDKTAIALAPFQITGSLNNTQGSPLSGPVKNGDVVEFRAEVKHPASDEPLATQLFWQVYDPAKRPIEGLNKPVNTYEKGGAKTYTFRFRLDNFNNGDYTVGLTHRLASNPSILTQAVLPFRVFEAAKIDRLIVTDGKGSQANKTELYFGDAPQMFVYYTLAEGAGMVKVELTAREAASGNVIESAIVERPRDGETPPHRVGLGLPAEALKEGDKVIFEVRITPKDGKTQAANTTFSIVPEKYQLKINAPRVIVGNQIGEYSITLPDNFEPPFAVDVKGGVLNIKKMNDPLRGKFQGPVTAATKPQTLSVVVRDAKNRTATGSLVITVQGVPQITQSEPVPITQSEPVYVQPEKKIPQATHEPRAVEKSTGGGQDDYQQKVKGIMDKYNQDMKNIQTELDAKKKAIKQEQMQQTKPGPAAPPSMTGGTQGGQSKQKKCRTFVINVSHCEQNFYSCMKGCPKTGSRSTIGSCHTSCGNADRACKEAKCPGGKISGVGWNINCTICQ